MQPKVRIWIAIPDCAFDPGVAMHSVLIVEDDALMAELYAELLDEVPFVVCAVVASNAEALSVLQEHRPQAVILDYRVVDGICHATIDTLRLAGIPCLVVSGSKPSTDLEFQGIPWLEKPFLADDLRRSLLTVIATEHADLQSSSYAP